MKKIFSIIMLILILALAGCGSAQTEEPNTDEMIEKIENAMYEVLGDDLKKLSQHELIATMTYAMKDGTGDGIQYHMIKSTYFEEDPSEITGFNENAVGVLFDVASADSSEEMQINEWAACRYRVNEKSFLCFTYSTEMTYVLEYNAEEVSDEEIIKMAESAAPME